MKNLLLFFLLCFCLNTHARTKMTLRPGTISAGGTVHMPIQVPKEGQAKIGFNLSPALEYFFSRGFALNFSPHIEKPDLVQKTGWILGLGLDARYYLSVGGAIFPYVGAGAGFLWDTKNENWGFNLDVPLGALVPLNNRVALNFGLPLNFLFSTQGYEKLVIPVGYLGVSAFF